MNNIITEKSIRKTVTIKNGKEVVRSDELAKMFEKQHKHIIELIKKKLYLFQVETSTLKLSDYFIEEKLTTAKGREYSRYYLTKKGFDFIILSFQGKKADLYKLWYIEAFHSMHETLIENKIKLNFNKSDDLWIQFREEGKEFRNKLTNAIRDTIVKYRNEIEKKMNDGRYYQNYSKMILSALNIKKVDGFETRDILDKRTLVRLEDLEDKVSNLIIKYHNDGVYYKDAYKLIKDEVLGA